MNDNSDMNITVTPRWVAAATHLAGRMVIPDSHAHLRQGAWENLTADERRQQAKKVEQFFDVLDHGTLERDGTRTFHTSDVWNFVYEIVSVSLVSQTMEDTSAEWMHNMDMPKVLAELFEELCTMDIASIVDADTTVPDTDDVCSVSVYGVGVAGVAELVALCGDAPSDGEEIQKRAREIVESVRPRALAQDGEGDDWLMALDVKGMKQLLWKVVAYSDDVLSDVPEEMGLAIFDSMLQEMLEAVDSKVPMSTQVKNRLGGMLNNEE